MRLAAVAAPASIVAAGRKVPAAYILTYEPQVTPDPFQPFADRAELVAQLERVP